MTQTRLSSFYEACINIVIGFSLNFVLNLILIPMFAVGNDGLPAKLSFAANFWMGCAFTIFSLIRSYAIRRWFNTHLHKLSQRLAA